MSAQINITLSTLRSCRTAFALAVALFAGAVDLLSQTYFFDNYSTKQNFESKVYAIVQDNRHYVWLGTQSGVSRFDGINFVSYSVEQGLAEGGVRVLFIDAGHNLWLGHEGGGITRYNGKTFEEITLSDSLLTSNITSINQDSLKRLWITTASDGALMIKNPAGPAPDIEFEHYLKGRSLGDQVFGSLVTRDGDIYFITNVGIRQYNKTDHTFETYIPKGMSTYFSPTVMFEDSRGNFWLGTYNGGLTRFDIRNNSLAEFTTGNGLASNWVTAITEDRKGNIWVGHWKGDGNPGGITRIDFLGQLKIFNTSNGLHDDHVWCITEDAEGNMLIGTTEQGLDIFKDERFIGFSQQNGLVDNQVNAITTDPEGNIWLGTNHGISVYTGKPDTQGFFHFDQSNNPLRSRIRCFARDSKHNIYAGTADQGIIMYSTDRKQFMAQPAINSNIDPRLLVTNGITALAIDSSDHLWIGTSDGLVEYDLANNRYVNTHTQGSGLAGNYIASLYYDSNGNLWIGSESKNGLTLYTHGMFSIVSSVGEVAVTCIAEDHKTDIWIGTRTKGVGKITTDTVTYFTVQDGMLANLVNLLVCDKYNNIYAGTNFGLNKIDQHTRKIQSYTHQTGFTGIETNNNAWCFDYSGALWIGTADGAMRCNIDLLADEDSTAPVVHFNEMQVKQIPYEMQQGIRFPSSESDFIFSYISISLKNPEGIYYQLLLEGLHDTWQDMQHETSVSFAKLRPGKYTLKVRARNDHSNWSEHPATFTFRILPPFYMRLSFILTMIILLLAGVIAYIKIRERNLVREKRMLEEKVQERTVELSAANELLSVRNRDITDSINYARRIQFSILPPDIPSDNTFVLFKPKDIVSGDFYWITSVGGREFLAAVDCTGHGVPGAFMSFIGYTALNKIIIEQGIYTPSVILDHLNREVALTLHQKGENIVNDGMDIALVSYSGLTGQLEYAGAFNPLVVARKGEIIEIKADRFAIGRSTGTEKKFTNHNFALEKGDMLYLFSDGYADQFGGPGEKKFKASALKELLAGISRLTVDQQREKLEQTFEEWKGALEQIDDVLIVGRRC